MLLGGLLGILLLGRRRAIFLASTLLLYLAFSFVDRLGNWYQVIMPVYPLLVATFCMTMAYIWQWLDRRAGSEGKRWAVAGLVVAALVTLIALRFTNSWPATNQRDQIKDTALLPGQLILAADPPAGATILGVTDEALSLRYITEVWGVRPDVTAVSSAEASEVLRSGERPLLVTVSAVPILQEEVPEAAYLSSAGQDLIAAFVQPPIAFPDSVELVEIDVGEGLVLAGFGVLASGGWNARCAAADLAGRSSHHTRLERVGAADFRRPIPGLAGGRHRADRSGASRARRIPDQQMGGRPDRCRRLCLRPASWSCDRRGRGGGLSQAGKRGIREPGGVHVAP